MTSESVAVVASAWRKTIASLDQLDLALCEADQGDSSRELRLLRNRLWIVADRALREVAP